MMLVPGYTRRRFLTLSIASGASASLLLFHNSAADGKPPPSKPMVFAAAFAMRGFVCGLMTTAGGISHTLPHLIPEFRTATAVAVVIVAIELLVISWIRNRYMDTPFLRAAFQVIVGGVLVFLVGIWIGSS